MTNYHGSLAAVERHIHSVRYDMVLESIAGGHPKLDLIRPPTRLMREERRTAPEIKARTRYRLLLLRLAQESGDCRRRILERLERLILNEAEPRVECRTL
eukprot:scaffold9885_cov72-Skeletonema_dohrnii-CCMP3373.AAC.2